MALIYIEEPRTAKQRNTSWEEHPVLALGFRPFYFLAAAFAAVSVPLWIARYLGWTGWVQHADLNWHMHEMIFGFAIAVIIGFLYTAGRNWTGMWTPRRKHLAALAALWITGRLTMLSGMPLLAAIVDFAFLPVATWPLVVVLRKSGNKRNMFLTGLLALLAGANAAFHASLLGWIPLSPMRSVYAAIMVIVVIEYIIGGRVIPNFTANAVRGSNPVINVRNDQISLGFTVFACIAWIGGFPAPMTAAAAIAAACTQIVRLAGWKPHCTLKNPLLWILHVSYVWIPIGFILLALAALGRMPTSAAIHVLAIGAMGGLIIGMITRTTLGHTGRALKAGASEKLMYALILLGAIARLLAAVDTGGWRNTALTLAMTFWTSAFLLYAVVYGPYLFRARLDGREG